MVRTFDTKYGAWLAGYYDDFTGARAVASDFNIPSKTAGYDHAISHYGNALNGEATLNPRFRWSYADRDRSTGSSFFSLTSNKYLKNNTIADWLGNDKNRNQSTTWGGKAQLQYPDGNTNVNKYRFNGSGSDAYQMFTNGYRTGNFYVVPTGDDDATYGRKEMSFYNATNFGNSIAGKPTSASSANFLQKAHLTGTWLGEATDISNTTNDNVLKLFAPVKSPSGQPFLCIQSYRAATTSGAGKPTIYYEGSLNSALDGDTFSARVAVRSFRGTNRTHGLSAIGSDGTGKEHPTLQFRVGFAKPTANLTNSRRIDEDGYEGTPAIDYTLNFYNNSLLNYDFYGEDTTSFSNDDAWIDVDFVIDYTAGTYKVFINGTQDTSQTFNLAGSPTAATMYGWEMTLNAKAFSSGETGNGAYSPTHFIQYLMLDRVGILHHLSDSLKHDSNETPIKALNLDFNSGGVSNGKITLMDDPQYESGTNTYGIQSSSYYNKLTNIIKNTHDWQVLIYADENVTRRDRPIFRGMLSKFDIKQNKNLREFTLTFNEPSKFMETQIPLWEIGQKSVTDESNTTAYWLFDAAGFKEVMNFGSRSLKILNNNIGFDVDDNYADRSDSRMQLGSGHPIQMYNNENENGPNSLEQGWEGARIQSIYEKTVSSTTYTVIKLSAAHGIGASQSVTISNTTNYNGTFTTASPTSGTELYFAQTDVPYVAEAPKIIYAGKYYLNDGFLYNDFLPDDDNFFTDALFRAFPSTADATNGYVNIFVDANPLLNPGDKVAINSPTEYPNALNVVSVSGPYRNFFQSTWKTYDANNDYEDPHKFWVIHTDEPATSELGTYAFVRTFTGVVANNDDEITQTSTNLLNIVRKGHLVKDTNAGGVITGSQFVTNVTGGPGSSIIQFDDTSTGAVNGGSFTAFGDGMLQGNDRLRYVNDDLTGIVSHSSFEDAFANRTVHAKWMRDLPKSLWFQFHYGIIGKNHRGSSPLLQAVTPSSTHLKVQPEFYNSLTTDYGVGEIIEGDKISRFIFRGKHFANPTGTPEYFLTGVKFINQDFTTDATINIARIEEDYKHIWLLWADMRNDGTADADGATRKTEFGLKYPTDDNYDISLFFTDSFDEKGNIKKFGDLKIGNDIGLRDVDATNDPSTGQAFSKPVDYANKKTVQVGLGNDDVSNNGGNLRIHKDNHGFAQGDNIHVWDLQSAGVDYSGYYGIQAVTTNTLTLRLSHVVGMTGTLHGTASTTNKPTFHMAKATGSEAHALTKYHDWEDKAGAFIVVDASRFFNLNTGTNEGRTGQDAGGSTQLEDYVATIRGYPALIDNYYATAVASSKNLGALFGEHPNADKMLFDSTTMTADVAMRHTAIRVDNANDFGTTGTGRIDLVKSTGGTRTTDSIAYYFIWSEKLVTEITGTVTGLGVVGDNLTLTDTNQSAFSNIKEGMMVESLASGRLYRVTSVDASSDEVVIHKYDLDDDNVYDADDWAVGVGYRLEPQLANAYIVSPSEVLLATDISLTTLNRGKATGQINIVSAPSTSSSTTNITSTNGATIQLTSFGTGDRGTAAPLTRTYIFRNDVDTIVSGTLSEDFDLLDTTMVVNQHNLPASGTMKVNVYHTESETWKVITYTGRTELGNGTTQLTGINSPHTFPSGASFVQSRQDPTHSSMIRVDGTGSVATIAADLEAAINGPDGNNRRNAPGSTAGSQITVTRSEGNLSLVQNAVGTGGNKSITLQRYGNQSAGFVAFRGMAGGLSRTEAVQVVNKSNVPDEIRRMYNAQSNGFNQVFNIPIGVTTNAVSVTNSISSDFALRMMMHIEGAVGSTNTGTYWNHDKFRTLWSAATMNTWLPPTNINVPIDINNIPVTYKLAYQNDTSVDSWGGEIDSRGKALGNIINKIETSIGYADGGNYLPFIQVAGRDGRLDLRPHFNSGIALDRTNLKKSDVSGGVVSKISNVRLYYDEEKAFVDFPSTNFHDTTKWKVLHYPEITSSTEALLVAQKEFSKLKESPLRVQAEPIRESNVEKIMVDSGRFGYISDPYRVMQSADSGSADTKYWTRIGTGGCLFPGQVNALDGNLGDATGDIRFRKGRAKHYATNNVPFHQNYWWYGANSLSYAMQIVHVPNSTPLTSTTTGNDLRVFIALKNGQTTYGATAIETDAQFTVYLVDYVFDSQKNVTSVAGVSSKNIKGSGFYEIDIPSSYGAVANAKIVFSANAEYLKSLLRHRCNFTENETNILKNAHVLEDGSSSTALSSITTGNVNSIFPLGGRAYTDIAPNKGIYQERTSWYAPRINITRDLSYWPGTFVKYTDEGLDLNNETMTIQNIRFAFDNNQNEKVTLALERDATLLGENILSYLFPQQVPLPDPPLDPDLPLPPPSFAEDAGDSGTQTISTDDWDSQNPKQQNVDQSRTDNQGDNYRTTRKDGVNQMSQGAYRNMRGFSDLTQDLMGSRGQFRILGQKRPSKVSSSVRPVAADIELKPIDGRGIKGAEGYVLPGSGLPGAESGYIAKNIFETELVVPRDIISDQMEISAEISHGVDSTLNGVTGIVSIEIENMRTQTTTTSRSVVPTNLDRKTMYLLPTQRIENMQRGDSLKIRVIRDPNDSSDTSSYNSIILHNIRVNMQRANNTSTSASESLTPYE